MSIARVTSPVRPVSQVTKPRLRAVELPTFTSRSSMAVVGVITLGSLAIALLGLIMHMLTSSAVYELASIQKEKRELTTTAQILSEEVGSLSSQQNLANAAQKLGMIANANPVFLRIEDQKVFGKPKAALDTSGRVSRNLVPNAALTERSTLATEVQLAGNLGATAETGVKTQDVAPKKTNQPEVVSTGGVIPASPTH
ncbi:hypothetical protein [Candidatus Rhodoluna planktonica]|uniref:Cell division protein FtsL n=1 Tax=Candidatus Rhodoluna planktonica TaxID=535712 RepID=A0A1D9DZD9_9MICO|nr:hypothetical protein [Candidatus Rhodoluna planktonica]AOY56173.1 hypothetical protein A4Z71_04180 [Candidatus Rhodoluna planktonica]